MQVLENLVVLGILGFLVIAGVSLWLTHAPEVPAFARRQPTSSSPQLRHDLNAHIFNDRGFLFRKRLWFVATCCPPMRLDGNQLEAMSAVQRERPVNIGRSRVRRWWWFEDAFYWESAGYSEMDVLALVRDRQRKNKQRLARAHTLLNVDQAPNRRRREVIPREVRQVVFRRDGGRCVQCGEDFDLQYDHIIPVALGGASTVENLQLLCAPCNQEKSANL